MNQFLLCICLLTTACNREMRACYFLLAIRCSGRVRALNVTVPLGSGRVGSDDLGFGLQF